METDGSPSLTYLLSDPFAEKKESSSLLQKTMVPFVRTGLILFT